MAKIDPLVVLQARAEARAMLFEACCFLDLGQALDPLYRYARRERLPAVLGADAIIAIIESPFLKIELS